MEQKQSEWNEQFANGMVIINQCKDDVKWSLYEMPLRFMNRLALVCQVVLSCSMNNREKLQFLTMKNLLEVNTCFQVGALCCILIVEIDTWEINEEIYR